MLKKHITLSLSVLFLAGSLYAQELRTVKNEAFQKGEKLRYRAYYESFVTGKVTAGVGTLEISSEFKNVGGRNAYHVVGRGMSKGAFNLFYKVNDRFETYIDEQALIPWIFVRRINEGTYKKDEDVVFDQRKNLAVSKKNSVKVPENVQDIISMFYYARTLDFTNAKIGDQYPITFYLEDSVYTTMIRFTGREVVETDLGKFKTLVFKPMVLTGNVFSQPYPMTVWITDDKNHIPLIAESGIIVGSVKLELIKYSGLANPTTSKVLY